jgi:uncharacterized protein YegL
MTKPNYTHIVALLDRSGSMQVVQGDTIGGFNTFVEEQKKVPGEATLTLVQFSDKCETTFADVPLNHVAPLNVETYKPSGWTALNDALAKTVHDVGSKLSVKPEKERPSKVIVLVMTDGAENSSKEFVGQHGLKKLSSMVTHQKEKYNWEFVFIGANIDAFAAASHYGIGVGQTINYTSDSFGQQNAFKSLSKGLAATRTSAYVGAAAPVNFFENDANLGAVSNATLDTSSIEETIGKYLNKDKAVTPPTKDDSKPTNQ